MYGFEVGVGYGTRSLGFKVRDWYGLVQSLEILYTTHYTPLI